MDTDQESLDIDQKILAVANYLQEIQSAINSINTSSIDEEYDTEMDKKIRYTCIKIKNAIDDILSDDKSGFFNTWTTNSVIRFGRPGKHFTPFIEQVSGLYCKLYDVLLNKEYIQHKLSGNFKRIYYNNLVYKYYLKFNQKPDYDEMFDYVKLNDPKQVFDKDGVSHILLKDGGSFSRKILQSSLPFMQNNLITPQLPSICFEFLYNKIYSTNLSNPVLIKCQSDLEKIASMIDSLYDDTKSNL